MTELTSKLKRIRDLAAGRGLDGVLLQRVSSLAWLTCGASTYVNTARTEAEATLLVTRDDQHLFTNNIEAVRLEMEEHLKLQGWNFHVAPWYETNTSLRELTAGLRLASDACFPASSDLSSEIAHLRVDLTPPERERFRELGQLCAAAMDAAARSVCPGQTEFEIAGRLAQEAENRGVQATVNLIATDERILDFRHPLPTAKKLERYAMLVLCGRRHGLVCSLTRLVHFGPLAEKLRRKAEAVARVDAILIASTRPGQNLGAIFQQAVDAYSKVGHPDEWHLHHQGGPAGYEPREYIATPSSTEQVKAGQAYAWNPSITGTKSEDTMLIGEEGLEVLTAIPGWPVMQVEVDGLTLERPAILEVL